MAANASAAELSALEQALNKNDKLDMHRVDDLVEKAERLETTRIPEKHEHDATMLDKMVDFQKRNSQDMAGEKKR